MTRPRILVAGIGNIFLGDDAFGVEVAQRLTERILPEGVRVIDFGIRGFDLTYALLDGYEAAILVDATQRGGPPGTLYVIEPTLDEKDVVDSNEVMIEPHGMDPMKVLRLVKALGGRVQRLLVVGCEPATLGSEEDMEMGMSEPVQAAVGEAVLLVESLCERILESETTTNEPNRRCLT